MNETDKLPDYYSFENRKKIRELTALLSEKNRNKLIGQRCTILFYHLRKYIPGDRGHSILRMRAEGQYLQYIKGIENSFIENQITRLKFEMTQLEGATVYLKDPRGMKIALTSIGTITSRIMEEVESMNDKRLY